MGVPVRILQSTEIVTRVAPLGVRFFDSGTGSIVHGLVVTAHSNVRPKRPLSLQPTPSGSYALHHAPGLRDFEHGTGDESFWAAQPAPMPYTLTVTDPQQRFLPFTFQADVPARGLLRWLCQSSPPSSASPAEAGTLGVPLFSTYQRIVPVFLAVVRANLYDPIAQKAAAWAVVEVFESDSNQVLGRGIADAYGAIAVILPYPAQSNLSPLASLSPSSPLSPPQAGISTWQPPVTLKLRVYYTPALTMPAPLPPAPSGSILPDLCVLLRQREQPVARVWEDTTLTTQIDEVTLYASQESVLRSSNGGKPLPELLISPAV